MTVRLGPSGTIAGRLLLPDGTHPGRTGDRHAALRAAVDAPDRRRAGHDEPHRHVRVHRASRSARSRSTASSSSAAACAPSRGSLASNGQRVDVGDLVLDNAAPRVVSIDPLDRSAGVTLQPAIAVTFSEPMRTSTFQGSTGGNVILLDGATSVQLQSLTFSNGNRTVTHPAGAGAAQQRGLHADDPRRPGRAERRGRRSAAPRRFREHVHDRRQHRAGGRRRESGQRRERRSCSTPASAWPSPNPSPLGP